MHLTTIRTDTHPLYASAMQLYRDSFPFHEQREAPSQAAILRQEDYHFSLLFDHTLFVGLALYWEMGELLYIEHLCILPELRNRRYGEQALELLKATGKTLLLEIDPPADPISRRRKAFYERCGFRENPFPHAHPPYHRGLAPHPLVIMTCPEPVSPSVYDAFSKGLRQRVMAHAFP